MSAADASTSDRACSHHDILVMGKTPWCTRAPPADQTYTDTELACRDISECNPGAVECACVGEWVGPMCSDDTNRPPERISLGTTRVPENSFPLPLITVPVDGSAIEAALLADFLVRVNVEDTNYAPTALLPDTASIAENTPIGTTVAHITFVNLRQRTVSFVIVHDRAGDGSGGQINIELDAPDLIGTGVDLVLGDDPGRYKDRSTCERSTNGYIGDSCQAACDLDVCQNGGTCTMDETADRGYTCDCPSGVTGYTCDRDIDECASSDSNGCDEARGVCSNTAGSYQCSCESGWQLASNGRDCEDVNECADEADNECDALVGSCTNTIGSYTCSCGAGYELDSDGHTCEDVDECSRSTHECSCSSASTCGSCVCALVLTALCWIHRVTTATSSTTPLLARRPRQQAQRQPRPASLR
ncbi:hypothetical protein PTSG_12267 [Salpingoeca rosetta]|uniref:EGF-like domain-containing protein n=1 Tax=Salpingoeca rosetta (strain ATCC 50818 / BSB-021) TaxID=946362 RepID=F2UAP4_SALR5|nr:uncharacterized protein PTSG_12267 [Salpingoeca rosetta]EGD73460.1 hypothetical protein PTSG_12267 [Salpingoeca rosetta]|eukprot:XP_004993742.1 hypothetical protein PTSG_12267 [Salpingoeca rosetta]